MTAVMTSNGQDSDWTPVRRKFLTATIEHLLPIPETTSAAKRTTATRAVVSYVLKTLAGPRLASQQPFVWAALDQLEAWAGDTGVTDDTDVAPTPMADPETREPLLRRLETDSNPYLVHALDLLLQLSLEGFLGDPRHGGNPDGGSWVDLGLPPLGPRQRLAPPSRSTGGGER